ncbi:phosphotransferase [Kineococcus sp. GCM10028916]|uniref:phosphotransferase n=1 Tax=Kineococcus sp. GCM10028916 TaxID=3273394 RepID=UPI003626C12C
MQPAETADAVRAASAVAGSEGLEVGDAVVLQNSNKLTLRLLPADVLARVAPESDGILAFEVDLARRLAAVGSPAVALDPRVRPRVHVRNGFGVTFWEFHPVRERPLSAEEYARALRRLHEDLRGLALPFAAVPHVTERVDRASRLLADRDRTPEVPEVDRTFLAGILTRLRDVVGRGPEQVIHGEPHEGNVLATESGAWFVDLETCCRGPVEFDLAHAPDDVADHYPGLDPDLLRDCRALVLAIVTTWRWDRDDALPNGRELGREWIAQLRAITG